MVGLLIAAWGCGVVGDWEGCWGVSSQHTGFVECQDGRRCSLRRTVLTAIFGASVSIRYEEQTLLSGWWLIAGCQRRALREAIVCAGELWCLREYR